MGRLGLETYAGYTRCQHCGIYDSDPRWCDLCGMGKEIQRIVDRNGRVTAGSVPNKAVLVRRPGETLVAGRAGRNRWGTSGGERHAGGGHSIG
jgi:hypothetical protein